MLVPGKGFSLRFSQHNDCIIDAETVTSRLLPNAFTRFWRPWKRRFSEPTSKGLRQRVVCHHRVCCAAPLFKCCCSKIAHHLSFLEPKVGFHAKTSRFSPDHLIGDDRCRTVTLSFGVIGGVSSNSFGGLMGTQHLKAVDKF